MLPLDREMHLQRITVNKNIDYLGNTYDETTKGTSRSKTGYFAESSHWCVYLYTHNIMHLYQPYKVSQKESIISRRLKSSALDIFYFSPFSFTCTNSKFGYMDSSWLATTSKS